MTHTRYFDLLRRGAIAATVLLALSAMTPPAQARDPYIAGDRLLLANFDYQALGAIASGGPALGQPVNLSANLDATVIANGVVPARALQLQRNAAGTQVAAARFEFLDGATVDAGVVFIRCDVMLPSSTRMSIVMREAGANAADFGDLVFSQNGDISFQNASLDQVIGHYVPGTFLHVSMGYHMDSDRIEIEIDQRLVLDTAMTETGFALGAVVVRRPAGAADPVVIDNLDMVHVDAAQNLLDADFELQTLGPVGTGGAAMQQPVEVEPLIEAVVTGAPSVWSPGQSLQVHHSGQQNTAQAVIFELLDDAQLDHGIVTISLRTMATALTSSFILVRERDLASQNYATLSFGGGGLITLNAADLSTVQLGSYMPLVPVELRLEFNLDERTIAVERDGLSVLSPTVLPQFSAGIGSLRLSQDMQAVNAQIYDDIDITHFLVPFEQPPEIFAEGFEELH